MHKETFSRQMITLFLVIFVAMLGTFSCKEKESDQINLTKGRVLVIASYGGAFQEAQRKAFFEPFAKKYNVTIREETHTGDLARIKAMVESGSVVWDVIDVEQYMVLRGIKQNLYEKLDYSQIPRDELIPQALNDYGVANCFWSTVMAYNTDHFNEGNPHPRNWSEFWDIKRFPGPRSLRRSPISTLEFALMADGVKKDELYPLDINRALRSLDKIKDNITVWWEAGEQPAQLLSSGEVVLASAWNGRTYNARKDGKPVQEIWEGGLIDSDWWVVPRGSKNKELAMKFIAFASQAQQQANFPQYIPYGPINKNAVDKVSQVVLRDLPTAPSNLSHQIFIDSNWWDENQARVQEQWAKWLLK